MKKITPLLRVALMACLLLVVSGKVLAQYTTSGVYLEFDQPPPGSIAMDGVYLSSGEYIAFSGGYVMGGNIPSNNIQYLMGSGFSYPVRVDAIYPVMPQGGNLSFYGEHYHYNIFGDYSVRFVYIMNPPNNIMASVASNSQTCANDAITLYFSSERPLFTDNIVLTSVLWEYRVSGEADWHLYDRGSLQGYNSVFQPLSVLGAVSGPVNVQFRCRIQAEYPDALFFSPYSNPSGYYTIIPEPPRVNAGAIQVTPACHGQSNGKIALPGSAITANSSNMRWILRPGDARNACDPGLGSGPSNCGDMVDWSYGAVPVSQGISSSGRAPGTYTLWVLDGTQGSNCITPILVTIPELDELVISNNTSQTSNISCFGGNDGVISVTASGGNGPGSGYFFSLETRAGVVVVGEQPGSGSSKNWSGLPAGDYTAWVRDATCTTIRKPVNITISQPPQITGEVTPVQPTCLSPGNGSLAVKADPGATNYEYKLYPKGSSNALQESGAVATRNYTFSGLGGGDYTVAIRNADYPSCDGWATDVSLNTVSPLGLQLLANDSVSCYGGHDGHLQFSASGGSNAFRYTLSGNGITPVTNATGNFSGLTAGDYTITLNNAAPGCNDQLTADYTVYQRDPLQVQLQPTAITCAGKDNGVLRAVVGGGSAFYKYTWQQYKNGAWTGSSFWFETDTQIEGLTPGTYRVIITDSRAAGCIVTSDEIVLDDPAPLVVTNVSVTQAVCLADGAAISMSATGGDTHYTYAYSLDGGASFTNFTAADRLHTAGIYTLRVADGAGCATIDDNTHSVTLPAAALSFTTTVSDYHGFNLSCTHAGDGSITIHAVGGNGGTYSGYQYSLNDGPYQSTNTFTNLESGIYTIHVKDGRGCEVTGSVTLTEPFIVINATKQDIICYGHATGSITTNISGGAAPYAILMNGVSAAPSMANLAQGDYTLHITDANGCSKDTLISIVYTYPALGIQNLALTDISCYGSTGNINFTATGGDGTYQYWLSTDNWVSQTPYTIGAPLTAGDYALQVTDGHGCAVTNTGTLSITAPPAQLSFTAKLSDYNGYNISCAGGSNGFAQITATGGNGGAYSGYTYALDNRPFGSAAPIQNINAGTHILRVKDARGCEVFATYSFTESAQAIGLQLISKQDVTCAGIPAGSITVAGSGGAGGLQYSIDNTNWQSSGMFTGLVAGTYTVAVRDVNNCGRSITVQVNTQNAPIVVDNITRNEIVCFGTEGSINVQAHGGTGALTYEYSLDGGAFTAFNNNTGFHAGNYTVRIKDAAGCYSAVSDVLAITAPAAPLTAGVTISDFNGVAISCYGLADGVINVAASGGNGAGYAGYQYSINNSAYTANGHYSNLSTGNYQIKIQDGRGCIITRNVVLQQPAAPVSLAVTGIENLVCGAQPTGEISLRANGGTLPYAYSLDDGPAQQSGVFSTLSAGNYALHVEDVNGCTAGTTANVTTQYPAIAATAIVKPVNCFGQADGAINVTATGGDGNYTYSWNTPEISGADVTKIPAGEYALTIADGTGCNASFNYEVEQPVLLSLAVAGPPVCEGLHDGHIDINTQGGIPPYQYSLNGDTWQTNTSFSNLAAGVYNIAVQDANGCTTRQDVTLDKANTKPDIDFLVASRKNALDTLAIQDISFPAPDHLNWRFSPEATLLGYKDGTPLIKFNAPGTYWVEISADFGSCTYTVRKDITISAYDPLAGAGYSLPVQVIDAVTLSPNPNDGNFRFKVSLNRKQQVVVYVYDINGGILGRKQYTSTLTIDDQFSLNNTLPGTYVLRVIAENESRDLRFIITN
ncbi:T9SS type A sorting domain-containing protein [Chitinophaga agrisoli]|uniref:T9SS type A sorting domain-containing protein n=1 Tax=Chitinophaga agrisoli TaxID=2607653 RepID=A0A5B2VWQ6_9BACT|nr:T9SS type A sorting domain-containing protein [Chitinophaga agrisoli]KAA2242742.1 T9SS type A sorting domain-containing protein [Chitinophaga agrisoli]